MNVIVSLMAAGAKKNFTKEEFRRVRKEADARYRKMVSENKDCPKALKKFIIMPPNLDNALTKGG